MLEIRYKLFKGHRVVLVFCFVFKPARKAQHHQLSSHISLLLECLLPGSSSAAQQLREATLKAQHCAYLFETSTWRWKSTSIQEDSTSSSLPAQPLACCLPIYAGGLSL